MTVGIWVHLDPNGHDAVQLAACELRQNDVQYKDSRLFE